MKKSIIVTLVSLSAMFLFSCGTSKKEKDAYQQTADQARINYFGDTVSAVANKATAPVPPLVFLKEIEIPAVVGLFSPKNVFSESNGIANFWHGPGFSSYLYKNADLVPVSPSFKLSVYETTKFVGDYEISVHTKESLLSETEFYQTLLALIAKQPNGELGVLLTNGRYNVFHVKMKDGTPLSVLAHWRSVGDHWYLRASRFDAWIDRYRVFARTINP